MANDKNGMRNISHVKRNGVLFQEYTNSKGNIVREAFDGNGKRLAKGIMSPNSNTFDKQGIKTLGGLDALPGSKAHYAMRTLSEDRGMFVNSKPKANPTVKPKSNPTD